MWKMFSFTETTKPKIKVFVSDLKINGLPSFSVHILWNLQSMSKQLGTNLWMLFDFIFLLWLTCLLTKISNMNCQINSNNCSLNLKILLSRQINEHELYIHIFKAGQGKKVGIKAHVKSRIGKNQNCLWQAYCVCDRHLECLPVVSEKSYY